MRKFYYALSIIFFATLAVSSCKIDPPVLPDNLQEVTNGNGGNIPASGNNTIKVRFNNGTEKTYSQVTFVSASGINSITGFNGTTDIFAFSYVGDGVGAFDSATCTFGNYSNSLEQTGKVTVTQITMDTGLPPKGVAKGSFEIPLVDASDTPVGSVTGSFNIKQ